MASVEGCHEEVFFPLSNWFPGMLEKTISNSSSVQTHTAWMRHKGLETTAKRKAGSSMAKVVSLLRFSTNLPPEGFVHQFFCPGFFRIIEELSTIPSRSGYSRTYRTLSSSVGAQPGANPLEKDRPNIDIVDHYFLTRDRATKLLKVGPRTKRYGLAFDKSVVEPTTFQLTFQFDLDDIDMENVEALMDL